MRSAVIDIGSNSIKLIIGENVGEEIKIIEFLKNVIGIGQNTFYRGHISQAIFTRAIDVLNNYKKIIQEYAVDTIKVVATTAVRESSNKDIFIDTIRRSTGLEIEVLNVGDIVYYIDAYLSYKLSAKYPIHEKNLIIAELGAGSLDISILEKGFTLISLGLPIGTLRIKQFKEMLSGSRKETCEALQDYISNRIQILLRMYPNLNIDDVILIDESYTEYLRKIQPKKNRPQEFFPLKFNEAKQFLRKVTEKNLDVLSRKYNIPLHVSEIIDGYAYVINNLFQLVKQRTIYMLEVSLSEAILANIIFNISLSKKYNKTKQLISTAKFLSKRYGSNYRHVKHLAFISEQLFLGMKEYMGLKDESLLYLLMAAYLHSIGQFIGNRAYHKHTEYIVSSLNLFRLTELEMRAIACIARYHRKATPQPSHYLFGSLPVEQQIMVQKLSSLLRIAHSLDASGKQKIKNLEIVFKPMQEVNLIIYANDSLVLEKTMFAESRKHFENVSGLRLNIIIKTQK